MAAFTPVRIVCNNILHGALGNSSHQIKIRHTENAKDRLAQAHKIMGIWNQLSAELSSVFNQWAKVRIKDAEVQQLIQMAMVPKKEMCQHIQQGNDDVLSAYCKNTCDKIIEYHYRHPTQATDSTRSTVFGVYNAITGYFQNSRTYKTKETKIKFLLYGGAAQIKTQKAFGLCAAFVQGEQVGIYN